MQSNTSTILQANSSFEENNKLQFIRNLLTLFSFTEELVQNITYIQQTTYRGKIKNEKYKKAFADFYNRLPTLEIFTASLDSEIIKEYLVMTTKYNLKNTVL